MSNNPQIKTLETTITPTIESPYPSSAELEGYEREFCLVPPKEFSNWLRVKLNIDGNWNVPP